MPKTVTDKAFSMPTHAALRLRFSDRIRRWKKGTVATIGSRRARLPDARDAIKTRVTDNVGGDRHGRNIRGTRGKQSKRSDTFTDERRAHVVLRETLHHPLQPALA